MKYVWALDQHKIAAEVTGLGRVSIWVNGTRILRSYAFTFGTQPLPFRLSDGREVALKPTRVLLVNGQELEPLEPFVAQCDVCASPMTAHETSCGDCGHKQLSHSERRKHKSSLRRARRPLTMLSLFYLAFAISQFVQMCREDNAASAMTDVAVAQGKIIDADAEAQAEAHDTRADAHAERFAAWSLLATIMGLLWLLSRRFLFVGLSLGLAVFAFATFNMVRNQGGLSFAVTFVTWPFAIFFVRAFIEARALAQRN